MSDPDTMPASAGERPGGNARAALLGVVVLAAVLRFVDLNEQLWIDEISALVGSLGRPVHVIASRWPGAASHVLYEILARLGLVVFGPEPWAIRLPAALAGIAGVWALHRVAARVLSPAGALAAAALAAVSYHHVFYSQNARGYTLLMLFFLLATDRLMAMERLGAVSRRNGMMYAGAGALAGYAQIFGVVVIPAQALLVVGLHLAGRGRAPVKPFLRWAALGMLATGLLYAPFVRSVLAFVVERSAIEAEGPRLGLGLLREAVEGLAAGLGGPLGFAVAAGVALYGLVVWLRSDSHSFGFMVAPLLLQAGVFAALGAGAHPRYFAIALPTAFIVGAAGLAGVARAAAGRVFRTSARRRAAFAAMALTIAVLVSSVPLVGYYRYPKQDFRGAVGWVDERAEGDDIRAGARVAGNTIRSLYDPDVLVVENLADLRAIEGLGRRVWLYTTLEGLLSIEDSALVRHVHTTYERVASFPGTVGDGHVRIYLWEPR